MCRPAISQARGRVGDQRAGVVRGEAELRARLAGQDRLVRVRVDARRDAQQHALRRGRPSSSDSRRASSALSSTIVPTPASSAIASSARDLALPCR